MGQNAIFIHAIEAPYQLSYDPEQENM